MPEQARVAARVATPPRSTTPVTASALAPAPRAPKNRVLQIAGAATIVLIVLAVVAVVRRPAGITGTAPSMTTAQNDAALARTLVAQSREREQAGNLAAARDLLEAALAADPANAEAHYRLANLLLPRDSGRARAEYEASRKLDPVRYGETVARILEDLK